MKSFLSFLRRLGGLARRTRLDREMSAEIEDHLARETERNLARGLPPADARFAALRAFGGVEQLKERERDARGLVWLESCARDLRHAVRSLRRNPGFAVATIGILALGLGGVTALFSTVHAVLVQPLAYPEAERLVLGCATYKGNVNPWASGPDYADYRDQSRSFAALEAFFANPFRVTLSDGRTADRVDGLTISAGMLTTLGAPMAWGRPFSPEDGRADAAPVVVVSHACWQKYFGGPRQADARASIVIDGRPFEVVGATAADFHFIYDVDVWFPLRPEGLGPRRFNNWFMLARLAPGVSLSTAQTEVDVIAAQLEQAYPDTNADKGLLLTPLQSGITKQYRANFSLLSCGAVVILLIACANATALLLARGATRQSELAVRAAIGASGWRLMRLLLAEAAIVAGVGGAIGIVAAVWMQKGLLQLLPVETVLLRHIGLSVPVLLFALTVTTLVGLGVGLLPAWRGRRIDPARDLRSAGSGGRQGGRRLRSVLVVSQVTASFLLLVVAGLLVRSLSALRTSDPGFTSRNLLTAEIPLPPGRYDPPRRTAFYTELLERVRALPGVTSAAAISQVPLRDPYNNIDIYASEGPPPGALYAITGNQRTVLPGYFTTMGIPLVGGRDVQLSDSGAAARVVVLSRQLALTLFPDRDPIGRHVVIDRDAARPWQVVGVVGEVKANSPREAINDRGTFYRPHAQQALPNMRVVIRTQSDPQGLVAPLRKLLQEMDPQVPLSGPRTMENIVAVATRSEHALTLFLGVFATLAVGLAAIGLYGLLAYSVAQQRRDIGIRMALGATRAAVAWRILREAGLLTLAGIGLGGAGALGASRLLQATLFGIGPHDPIAFLAATVVLLPVAFLAAWLPARRAALVDPMSALRAE